MASQKDKRLYMLQLCPTIGELLRHKKYKEAMQRIEELTKIVQQKL